MEPATPTSRLLNVFCMQEGDAWRVHLGPDWMPPELELLFDYNGEAYPVLLDWDDLELQMQAQGARYQTHTSYAGSVELTAEGAQPAAALARWVAGALASGVRTMDDDFGTFEPVAG